VEDATRAIDVHAADRDHAAGPSAEEVHERRRLAARAQDDVEDDLGRERVEIGSVRVELTPIALDVLDAFRELNGVRAAMEHRDLVAACHQGTDDVRSDESCPADDKNFHLWP
jgi:hypothetical protein